MMRFFYYLHLLGIIMLLGGVGAYLYPVDGPQTSSAMVAVASAIGLGLLMIAPYPVVKAIQWMTAQNVSSDNKETNP